MKDKTFRIAVIALLLLILGAVVGSMSARFFSDGEYLEFEDGEFIDDDSDFYQFERFSYGEFSFIAGQPINDLVDLNDYATNYGYESYDDFTTFYRENGCKKDGVGRNLCFEETLEAYDDEKVIERTIVGYHDE